MTPFDGIPPEPGSSATKPIAPSVPPIDWRDLATKQPPERRWAQKGWFGFGHITLLVGAGGIGKTLLSQQLASCLALGRPFVDEPPGPLRVLMWACEDDHDELWRRQLAISQWLQKPLDDFAGGLFVIPRHGLENSLVSLEFGRLMVTPLIEHLRQQVHDLEADVVILDNVAQLYGGNENDRHSVTYFMNLLAGILAGKATMLLAHPSRAQGSEFSGSGAWEAVARTRLFLGARLPGEQQAEGEDDENVRYLARRKANYSSKDWRKLNFLNGVLVPEAPEVSGGIVSEIRAKNAEAIVLAGFERLREMGQHPNDAYNSPRFLPKLLTDYKLSSGTPKSDLANAMRNLQLSGVFTKGKVGEYPNRTPITGLIVCTK